MVRSFSLALVFSLFAAQAALASPADAYCDGKIGKDAVTIVIGRETLDGPPSSLEVKKNDKVVAQFSAKQISMDMVIVVDEGNELIFTNPSYRASGERGMVFIRLPAEQDDGAMRGYVTLSIPAANLSAAEAEMTCDFTI